MDSFGEEIVKQAVVSKEVDPYIIYSILTLFDSSAFESEKPQPEPERQPTPVPQPPTQEAQFAIGDRIRIGGLQSTAGRVLNGVSAVLLFLLPSHSF
jgi:hypothetical protein